MLTFAAELEGVEAVLDIGSGEVDVVDPHNDTLGRARVVMLRRRGRGSLAAGQQPGSDIVRNFLIVGGLYSGDGT